MISSLVSLHKEVTNSALLDRAGGLLAICSGSSASGDHTRTFQFSLPTGSLVSVDVRDGSINSSSQDVLLGVQTWGSASVLARLIASSPQTYLPPSSQPIRVLELGAGTGLVSLVATKILDNRGDTPAEIIASDHDLLVIDNLRSNIARNSPYGSHLRLSAIQLDWQSFLIPTNTPDRCSTEYGSPPPRDAPLDQHFDVIFGADVVYEPHQAFWIKAAVSALLRRPHTQSVPEESSEIASDSRFHLVIPLRATHERESASVFATFPPLKCKNSTGTNRQSSLNGSETRGTAIRLPPTLTLAMVRMEELEPNDRQHPMRYLLCEIGWAYM